MERFPGHGWPAVNPLHSGRERRCTPRPRRPTRRAPHQSPHAQKKPAAPECCGLGLSRVPSAQRPCPRTFKNRRVTSSAARLRARFRSARKRAAYDRLNRSGSVALEVCWRSGGGRRLARAAYRLNRRHAGAYRSPHRLNRRHAGAYFSGDEFIPVFENNRSGFTPSAPPG